MGISFALGMHVEMANGEDTISTFIRDVMTTFHLNSPSILYGGEEAPVICYSDQGLRCLSSDDYEEGMASRYEEEIKFAGSYKRQRYHRWYRL